MSPISDAGCTPAAGDIRDALAGILSSDNFSRSPKISRLLTYLVNMQIAGDADSLKEVAIATSVFNQQPGFNPRTNPIVRVNASRLRNLLRLYYADPGIDDDVRITLPDVGYAPIFAVAPSAQDATAEQLPPDRGGAATLPPPRLAEQPHAFDAGPEGAGSDATGPRPSAAPETGWRGSSARIARVLGMPSSVAFVVANLVIACVFAALLNRASAPQGDYVISVPASEAAGIPPASLIMLCSHETAPTAAYPVEIGNRTVFCRPLKLRQTLLRADDPA